MRWTYRVNVYVFWHFIDISSWLVTLAISVVNRGVACVRFGCGNIHILSIYHNGLCLEHNAVWESNRRREMEEREGPPCDECGSWAVGKKFIEHKPGIVRCYCPECFGEAHDKFRRSVLEYYDLMHRKDALSSATDGQQADLSATDGNAPPAGDK